ncbi:MAG: site-2 protease family protein [bacterium]
MLLIAIRFGAVILALTFHEFMHAFAAYLQGDKTAQYAGRLTLNPLVHIDPMGTIFLPLMLSIAGLPAFGWAKPVPYNPYNLRNGRLGPVLVGLAGPFTNLSLFFISAGLYHVLLATMPQDNLLMVFLYVFTLVNGALGLFNIVPIPPLDGSKVLMAFADHPKIRPIALFVEKNGFFILLAYIFLNTPGLNWAYAKLVSMVGLI